MIETYEVVDTQGASEENDTCVINYLELNWAPEELREKFAKAR